MSTRIYGASDDLIEFDGDVRGEVGCYGTDDDGHPGVLLVCSDGTLLTVKYGSPLGAIWTVAAVHGGSLLDGIDRCLNEDEKLYSDVARFRDGLKWVFAAKKWERVE